MPRTLHKVLGAFHGIFYETEGGNLLYLAHKKHRQMIRPYSWAIEVSVLDKCRAEGIDAVGIICKHEGKRMIWLTHIDDFYGPDSKFLFADTKMRVLPVKLFRIDPAKSEKVIARRVRLR